MTGSWSLHMLCRLNVICLSLILVTLFPMRTSAQANFYECPRCGAANVFRCKCNKSSESDDCGQAKAALKSAIRSGSVWVEKNGQRVGTDEALKHIDGQDCGAAIADAQKYTGFGEKREVEKEKTDEASKQGSSTDGPLGQRNVSAMNNSYSWGRTAARFGKVVAERPPVSVGAMKTAGFPPGVDPIGQALKNVDDSGLPLWGPALQKPIFKMGQQIEAMLKSPAAKPGAAGPALTQTQQQMQAALSTGDHDRFAAAADQAMQSQPADAPQSRQGRVSIEMLSQFPVKRYDPPQLVDVLRTPSRTSVYGGTSGGSSLPSNWAPLEARSRVSQFLVSDDLSFVLRRYEWVGYVDGEFRPTVYSWVQRVPTGIAPRSNLSADTALRDPDIRHQLLKATHIDAARLRSPSTQPAIPGLTSSNSVQGFFGTTPLDVKKLVDP